MNAKIDQVMSECSRQEEALMDAHDQIKTLQRSHTALDAALQKLSKKAADQAKRALAGVAAPVPDGEAGGPTEKEVELSDKCGSLLDVVNILQTNKAMAEADARTCMLWRTRCVELQAQRDSAIEVACSVSVAQGVEEAHGIIRDHFHEQGRD